MVKQINGFMVNRSDADHEELFDNAVRFCLKNDRSKNYMKICELFAQSFVNEKKLRALHVGILKPGLFDSTVACSDGRSSVFIRPEMFKEASRLVRGVEVLFHEGEHIVTTKLENPAYYYTEADECLYLTSPNEHKSRLAQVEYAKKFVERMEHIISTEPEFSTAKNQKILELSKKRVKKIEKNQKKFYETALKQKAKKQAKFKRKILKYFKKVQKERSKPFWSERHVLTKTEAKNERFLLDYLNAYQDKEILNKAMSIYAKDRGMKIALMKTMAYEITSEESDLIIIENQQLTKYIQGGDLARHELLFYGEISTKHPHHQQESFESVQSELKEYKFNGIPLQLIHDKRDGVILKTVINNKVYTFKNEYQLKKEVAKYINSADLINFNEEKMEKINSVFGVEVVRRRKAIDKLNIEERISIPTYANPFLISLRDYQRINGFCCNGEKHYQQKEIDAINEIYGRSVILETDNAARENAMRKLGLLNEEERESIKGGKEWE